MKFLSIHYKNYRCFLDLKVSFNTKSDKNISIILAPNGGGKTEMLFSFWWVLYGFDFRTLKEKKDAPYSLNLAKYNNLLRKPEGYSENAEVILNFADGDKVYQLMRREIFTKKGNGIVTKLQQALRYKDAKGQTSPFIVDPDQIYRILTRIIPKRILHGIIFDGERMKQLSTVDDDAKEAIQGIIKDITNEELFERCRTELADIKRDNNKEEKKISAANLGKSSSLEAIISDIESAEQAIKFAQVDYEAKANAKGKIDTRLMEIAVELKKDETARELEIKRDKLRDKLAFANKQYDGLVQSFNDDLYDAYLLISNNLFDNVENSLQKKDIPEELTVPAVRNILKRDKCICGHDLGEKERALLEELIKSLPPDNVSSTLLEMTRQAKNGGTDVRRKLQRSYKSIEEIQKEIKGIKDELSTISSQLVGEGFSKKAKELENESLDLRAKLIDINRTLSNDQNVIDTKKREIEGLKKQKDSFSKNNAALDYLNKKDTLIRKFEDALEEIDRVNGRNALMNINEKLEKAYREISEDYERGRRIYIVQFNQKSKYRLVSYYANNYSELLMADQELIDAFKLQGRTADEIKEELILKICEPNSTGQSKINTLAFAKAILDYSNEERGEDSVEITKDYPFLIDSPFTELSDGNLEQSSTFIYTFAKQIILFISNDSYVDVKDKLDKHVNSMVTIKKHPTLPYSFIEDGGAK